MSVAAKLCVCTSVICSIGMISYVHYKQSIDREKLHEGVLKDVERQQRRKLENTFVLQRQIDLTKKLKMGLAREQDADGDE